jgi:hypothetical protein
MTTASTITGRVAEMHASMAALPPNEVMGAFAREQAALAGAGVPDGGRRTRPSDEARAAQLQLGLDLTTVNADGTNALPMPTVVIADASHVVQWVDVHPDYSTRTEPAQILGTLDQLGI